MRVPAFIFRSCQVDLDQLQVANYALWGSRVAIAAAQTADGFTPILNKLRHSVAAPVSEDV
jgi:hypothetical protein